MTRATIPNSSEMTPCAGIARSGKLACMSKNGKGDSSSDWIRPAWPFLLALGTAAVLALAIVLTGQDPERAFLAFIDGTLGYAAGRGGTAARAAILTFYALGIALSFRAGLLNIGAEGQSRMGAAAAVALTLGAPGEYFAAHGCLGIPALLCAGAAGGALWSLLAYAMKRWRDVPEVVATLMLNFTALLLVRFFVSSPSWLQGRGTTFQQNELPEALKFAGWGGTEFHAGVFLAIPAALAAHVYLFHTAGGMRLRAMGFNRSAARASGVDCGALTLNVFGIAGALAGMAGAIGIMAVGKLAAEPTYAEFGYMAIAVALVAELKPLSIVAAALIFAALEKGSESMEAGAGVSHWVVYALNGLLILAMLARDARKRKEG